MSMKKVWSLFVALLIALSMLPVSGMAADADFTGIGVVHTTAGDVSGVPGALANVTVFKGVPYAAAPVGDLRWKEPQDVEPWEGVRVCDTYAPAAIQPPYAQFMMRPGSDFYPAGAPEQSEDCLYLNITTPATSADEKLPVMVWFHGGGLAHGYSWQVPFEGDKLAENGVIVVTVGHRLGVFGFLALPQLSQESEYGASGNYGFMDCIKSVQWVHDNIAAFGGDPDRITVFGQSGGSLKTAVTVAAPQTQGMIAGFMNQSVFPEFDSKVAPVNAMAFSSNTLEESEQQGVAALEAMGLSADISLEELRAMPAEDLNTNELLGAAGAVTIDGKYVTGRLSDFFLGEGNLNGIAQVAGWVYGERGSYEAKTPEELFAMVRADYGDELVDKYDLEHTLPVTQANVGWYNLYLKNAAAMDELRLFAKLKAERNENSPTYLYTFGRVTPNKDMGWHSGELWYVFNELGYSFQGMDAEWQPAWEVYDYMVGDMTSAYWANFAKSGDPNGEGLAEWPVTTADAQPYEYIDVMSTSMEGNTSFDAMMMEYYMNLYSLAE